MNTKNAELLAGIFVLIGLAVMAGLTLKFGKLQEKFEDQYPLTLVFKNASGLIEGSEVRMGGAKVGRVTSKPVLSDEINVEVEISILGQIKLPKGAEFNVVPASLLGDMRIEINTPPLPHTEFISPGSKLQGAPPSGIASMGEQLEGMVAQTDEALGKINEALDSVTPMLSNLESMTQKLDQQLLSEQNLTNVSTMVTDVSQVSKDASVFIQSLSPLVEDLQTTIQSTNVTVLSLDQQINEIGPEAKRAIASANELLVTLNELENSPGLLGAIMNDPTLKEDTKLLLTNLRKHGILRYKDTEGEELESSKAFDRRR